MQFFGLVFLWLDREEGDGSSRDTMIRLVIYNQWWVVRLLTTDLSIFTSTWVWWSNLTTVICLRSMGLIHILMRMLTLRLPLFIISWWHNVHDHLSLFIGQYIPTMVVPLIDVFFPRPIFNNLWHSDAWDGYPAAQVWSCKVPCSTLLHPWNFLTAGCPK